MIELGPLALLTLSMEIPTLWLQDNTEPAEAPALMVFDDSTRMIRYDL
jgi:hypothetical protein